MALRNQGVDNGGNGVDLGTARDVVSDSLGMDLSELDTDTGTDDLEQQLDLGSDQGDDTDPFADRGDDLDQGDDQEDIFRVSHTEDDQERGRQRGDQQQQKQQRPLPKRSEVRPDRRGNLVDKDGQIVARAGREARIYQSRERARRDLSRAQAETTQVREDLRRLGAAARQLYNQNQQYQAVNQRMEEFGLSAQEQLTAMQLFSELRDNPQQGVRRILTRATQNGINIQDLLSGRGGNDPQNVAALVQAAVEKAVKPLNQHTQQQVQREQQQRQEAARQQQAQREVQDFFRRNPEARQYSQVFVRALSDPRYTGMSLGEIYARIIQSNPPRNGRRSRTPQNGMLRGRGMPSGGGRQEIAHPNATYESIIDAALADNGMPRSRNNL